ncbi:DUF1837 domain-containing protein [Niastella caeni]|uniref:DUF1837 domain-containing protein n=1 Tax=Niastella caeni TaxID=2569763 RepID=A0A4S8HJI7_9BACT|nr:DUF1837 domain-containing protein [Niastella caeni]THU33012.1 DUF1837 domain-containing protein [Niastella caeni]
MIQTSIKQDFLELFYSDISNYSLENGNKLNVFTLRIINNQFAYEQLVELLGNKLYHFALSRSEVETLKQKDQLNTLITKAKAKLREYIEKEDAGARAGQNEGGELGELLLYCLLECHLDAPKILSKLEIKTSNQMYVNGADGVHLLKVNSRDYQVLFGESKLHADLSKGIYEAFSSIATLLENRKNKLFFEIDLVNSQLVKEVFDDNTYQFLKKILLPSAQEDQTNIDYSFGIFLGFNINITAEEKRKSNSDFRKDIRERIKVEIEDNLSTINYQIRKQNFSGYNFYVYIIPFSELTVNRVEILNRLAQ